MNAMFYGSAAQGRAVYRAQPGAKVKRNGDIRHGTEEPAVTPLSFACRIACLGSALATQVGRDGCEALPRSLLVGDNGEGGWTVDVDVMGIGGGDDILRPGGLEELRDSVDVQNVEIGKRLIDED